MKKDHTHKASSRNTKSQRKSEKKNLRGIKKRSNGKLKIFLTSELSADEAVPRLYASIESKVSNRSTPVVDNSLHRSLSVAS